MHLLYGALSGPFSSELVTAGLLFTSQCLCETIMLTLFSMMWDTGFKSWVNAFLFADAVRSVFVLYCFTFLFLSIVWYCVTGLFLLIVWKSLSLSLASSTSFNSNNNEAFGHHCDETAILRKIVIGCEHIRKRLSNFSSNIRILV